MLSLEPEEASEPVGQEDLGSLRGCLVDGDAEQQRQERSIRRRSLAISIAVESSILTVLFLVSLFGKPQSITFAKVTPVRPYSPYRNPSQNPSAERPRPSGPQNVCRFCSPTRIPPTIAVHDSNVSGRQTDNAPPDGIIDGAPGAPDGSIPLGDARQKPLPPDDRAHQVIGHHIVHVTRLDPAMLIHRVEPVYPALARQIRRGGRVELRAIIATDGSIQSLQVVGGDAMFYQSAMDAVGEWRYRATVLNGQSVEIDTYITVVYTLQN